MDQLTQKVSESDKAYQTLHEEIKGFESKTKELKESVDAYKLKEEQWSFDKIQWVEDRNYLEAQIAKLQEENKLLKSEPREIHIHNTDHQLREDLRVAQKKMHVAFSSLGAIGQELWSNQRLSSTLKLTQGNITIAMMKFQVNLQDLTSEAIEHFMEYANVTIMYFVTFAALANRITIPLWNFLEVQSEFIGVRCL